ESLAEDLQRWLDGEPVRARRSGALERARKWARRHPAVAALGALLGIVVALGIAGIVWQWRHAVEAEDEALTKAHDAEEARNVAIATAADLSRAQTELTSALGKARNERDVKDRALNQAQGLRLAADAADVLPRDPTLSLLLAIE